MNNALNGFCNKCSKKRAPAERTYKYTQHIMYALWAAKIFNKTYSWHPHFMFKIYDQTAHKIQHEIPHVNQN